MKMNYVYDIWMVSIIVFCFNTISLIDALTCDSKFKITNVSDVTFDEATMVVVVNEIRSVLRCTSACGHQPQCVSIVYSMESHECRMYNKRAQKTIHGTGLKYAKITKNTCKHLGNRGDSCHSSKKCTSPNTICQTGTCVCETGYSYDINQDSCVQECMSYGTSFEEHAGFYILGYNNKILYNTSIESCLEQCLSETRFTCRTVERSSAGTCYLSEDTALTQPAAYTTSDQYTLWQRNCY